jgi:hypothetical protein
VIADGVVFHPDSWRPLEENEQRAAIAYQNEFEKMIIAIDFRMNDKAVWIFPLPAKPEKIAIDVVTEFPGFSGRNIEKSIQRNLMSIPLGIVYPAFILAPTEEIYPLKAGILEERTGVIIHEHLEKEGVIVELVTAESGNALYNYLTNKGLKVEKSAISIFDSYIGKEYSFVVAWISSSINTSAIRYVPSYCNNHADCSQACSANCPPDTYGCCVNGNIGQCNLTSHTCYCAYNASFCTNCPPCDYTIEYCDGYTNTCEPRYSRTYYRRYEPYSRKVGIFITFPTSKVFYPLLPTSVYGSKSIPVNIYLLGYFEPKVYPEIKSYTKTSYYIQDYLSTSLTEFFGSTILRNLPYTKVEIEAPSKYFINDLYFEESLQAKLIGFIVSHRILIILVVVIISAVAGGITGFIIYRKIGKFALIGMANIFTLAGVATAMMFTKTKKKFEAIDGKKLLFLIIFSVIYVVISLFLYFCALLAI